MTSVDPGNINDSWPNILVVDDDKRIRSLLSRYLWDNNFVAITAENAQKARDLLKVVSVDAMVVDVMMPGESGLDFTRDFTGNSETPVLMLTALGESDDRIQGLESGADDYLSKPFEPKELVLRLKSILRRTGLQKSRDETSPVNIGEWLYDPGTSMLTNERESRSLTQMEVNLLNALLTQPNTPVSRERLADLCGVEKGERTIDVQVTRLRRKIESDPKTPRLLQTVRGKGYILRTETGSPI